jgi:hypothetical protein
MNVAALLWARSGEDLLKLLLGCNVLGEYNALPTNLDPRIIAKNFLTIMCKELGLIANSTDLNVKFDHDLHSFVCKSQPNH